MAKPAQVSAESPALETHTPPKPEAANPLAGPATWVDDRVGLAKVVGNIRKVFPEHWSFLLGEIALYSFIILLLTGVFLTIWFKPSMAEVEY
ncbi:MAG TPA: ubiquinol-cytochrome c reductase cytochrome b subunit, partial [Propionicimonas sp.]|nr:ubiquinol-cytochrome c reductase cytochrome b subunit [Propionicimonas sp.]